MDHTRDEIYLAALLHDIGKFYQRADERLMREIVEQDEHLARMADLICPFNEESQNWGYQHALWAYLFFLESKNNDGQNLFSAVKENSREAFRINPFDNEGIDNLINFAIFHHKPKTPLQTIVQIADWVSSGMERGDHNKEKPDTEPSTDPIHYGKFKYKKVPLFSLFNQLITEYAEKSVKEVAFPLQPLDCLTDHCFTKELDGNVKELNNHQASEKYKEHWLKLVGELKLLPTDSISGFTESLTFLLKKYTWCIPASTNDMANVSLYEHLKTTAAVAQCLYDFQVENGFEKTIIWKNPGDYPKIADGIYPLQLVCWDLSGIQKFIYDISGRKAAVSLKGRSFYLQLLVESIIRKTIIRCKANWGNVVYSSGGKLFMIMPNLPETNFSLNQIKGEYERLLWEEHQGRLSICLGKTAFSFDTAKNRDKASRILFPDGSNGSLSDLWRRTLEAASENKFRKFETILTGSTGLSIFQEAGKWGKDFTVCAVTGAEGKKDDSLVKIDPKDEGENPVYVTKAVKNQKELGDTLKDANVLLTLLNDDENGSPFLNTRCKHISFPYTGTHHYIPNERNGNNQMGASGLTSADECQIRSLNETDFATIANLKGVRSSYGFMFYGGNKQAVHPKENRFKTFEELCWVDSSKEHPSSEKQQSTFLGVLRMDVDNLGKLFMSGIPEDQKSFATYATLSGLLDFFFTGYLNSVHHEFADYVNIIYSGGDDVFAVGRWDKIIGFAEKIRSEFQRFTQREDISISAGISIVGEKYPVKLAADESGLAEELSKAFKRSEHVYYDKNAITFFGQTVSWQYEWEEVKALKIELVRLLKPETGSLSKAILHQLMQWKFILDENRKGKPDLSYRWNTAYYLKRYQDRMKNDVVTLEFLEKLKTALFSGQGAFAKKPRLFSSDRYYDLAALAARWAEMEIKELTNKK